MPQYWNSGSLVGKSVIVTGAAQGIGRGIAQALAERGASVLITDINAEKLQAVHEELNEAGWSVASIVADVTLSENAPLIIEAAINAFGHIDGLVNNAIAGNLPGPFTDITDEAYNRVFDSGPYATFTLMKAVYPHLKQNGGGSIVNFASGAGTAGIPFMGAYAGAKEAIRGLSKSAMQEWGPDQIRVNMIAPYALSEGAASWKAAHPEEFARSLEGVPLRRIGDVHSDVGAVVSFLLSDDATYLTGQTIFVDGGYQSVR